MNDAAVTAYTLRRHASDETVPVAGGPGATVLGATVLGATVLLGTSEMYLDVRRLSDVDAVDEPDAVRVVLHDHRAGADAVSEEPHALHQRAVRHPGGGKDDVLPRRQIRRPVDLLDI